MRSDGTEQQADCLVTRATDVYDRLKADIIAARIEPGRKLQLRFLMDHYGAGQTPLREALNRLSMENLVEGREQRGFFVKSISLTELNELTKARCWIEAIALRESMANATIEWEETLILSHHRLERTPRSLDPEKFEDNPEWERHHRGFHAHLIANCESRPLIAFCEQLADRLYRYRALSIRKAFRVRKVTDEHKQLLIAVLDRQTDAAAALLAGHYQRTAEIIRTDLAKDDLPHS